MQYKYIDTEYPDFVPYFRNIKEAHIGTTTAKKVELECPCCSRYHFMYAYQISEKQDICCPACRDGFAYPERLMNNLLRKLGVHFIYQYTDTWTKRFRYDFYFDYKGKKYIVETDGGIGHGHDDNTIKWNTKQSILNDIEKDRLANDHDIIVIRIDCNYKNTNRLEYIQQSIKKSLLSEIFNLSIIDWDDLHKKSVTSLYREVIELYKKGIKSLEEISEKTGIKSRTIKKYLKESMDAGLLPKETIFSKKPFSNIPYPVIYNIKNCSSRNVLVYCYEEALLFGSFKDAGEYYNVNPASIRQAIIKCNGYYDNKHFVLYQNLPENFDFNPVFFPDSTYKDHIFLSFDEQNKLVDFYSNTKDFPRNIKYSNVFRAVKSAGLKSYGYYWRILPKEIEYQLKKINGHQKQLLYLRNNKSIFEQFLKGEMLWYDIL